MRILDIFFNLFNGNTNRPRIGNACLYANTSIHHISMVSSLNLPSQQMEISNYGYSMS